MQGASPAVPIAHQLLPREIVIGFSLGKHMTIPDLSAINTIVFLESIVNNGEAMVCATM
jgi:hypothetical protein